MKTIPSLVASSTVGIATAGLALGKPDQSSLGHSSSKKRKPTDGTHPTGPITYTGDQPDLVHRPDTSSSIITRDNSMTRPPAAGPQPDTQSRPTTANPSSANFRFDSPNSTMRRRLSIVRLGDMLSSGPEYNSEEPPRRDSLSSRGSWYRRLSIITLSQTASPRSSIGPDSPSLTFSNTSRAPILPGTATNPAQPPPNKLVKRAPSSRARSGTVVINQEPRQSGFRRPATSHQRRATLQQFTEESVPPLPETIVSVPPKRWPKRQPPLVETPLEPRTSWIPYFESRPTKLTKERGLAKSIEGRAQGFQPTSRRVMVEDATKPTLLKPGMISAVQGMDSVHYDEASLPFEDDEMDEGRVPLESQPAAEVITVVEDHRKRPRRSLSLHFTSPTSWITRSSSVKVDKRTVEGRSGGRRNSSAPGSTLPGRNILSAHGPHQHSAVKPPGSQDSESVPAGSDPSDCLRPHSVHSRPRNSSSPLPPLSRLSSFNVDLARLGLPSPSSSAPQRSPSSPVPQSHIRSPSTTSSAGYALPTTTTYFGSLNSKPRTSDIADRTSTLIGSDSDARGFTTGDEDEMDLQSDTVYDSIRTGATGSIRSYTTPLESMFDDSPQSATSNSKNKRLSIQELAGAPFNDGNKIVEEDEDMSTPVKEPRSLRESIETPVRNKPDISIDTDIQSTPKFFNKDFSGISLDDDDDEDWARDDEHMDMMALSPPSSSLNFRRIHPAIRMALADVTHTGTTNGKSAPASERPKSNLFDWSEPSIVEKMGQKGAIPRPSTAYSNQVADGRGGRSVGRKGPSALHIRSQSVPVVPDSAGQRERLTPKFGTWGLGAKGVSEDWDGDFEFDNDDSESANVGGTKTEHKGLMIVPRAIQESQANVVGHVGQIREFCLLVEDLKRLRILGREKDMLDGTAASLWKEAEGIIALAVPDEEDLTLSAQRSPSVSRHDSEGDDRLTQANLLTQEEAFKLDLPTEGEAPKSQQAPSTYDTSTVRRRHSVFGPEDDIFGTGAAADNTSITESLAVPPSSHSSTKKSSTEVARSVMETMHQHRSASDPTLPELTSQSANKMPFDTTSLRDLVQRAGVLTRTLAELIRKADGTPQSPDPATERESSPAFTRVFADPTTSPQGLNIPRSQNNTTSVLGGSMDASPTRRLPQQIHMLAVG